MFEERYLGVDNKWMFQERYLGVDNKRMFQERYLGVFIISPIISWTMWQIFVNIQVFTSIAVTESATESAFSLL